MEITLTTPALLFPTVSLSMLAYTNRFLILATIIRNLHDRYSKDHEETLVRQIATIAKFEFQVKPPMPSPLPFR